MSAELGPCVALLIGIVVMQVVPAHLTARQNVVLAPIDDVERHAKALHECGASAAQIVWRPGPGLARAKDQRVVVAPVLHWRARAAVLGLLEHRLTITSLLADRLRVDVPFIIPRGEAPVRVSGNLVQPAELIERERGEVHRQIGQVIFDVFLRNEPLRSIHVDVLPPDHAHLANAVQRRQHDPDRALCGGRHWLRSIPLVWRGIVLGLQLVEDCLEFRDLGVRKNAIPLIAHVVIRRDDLLDFDQLHRVPIDQQLAPRLPLFRPRKHLRQAVPDHDGRPVDAARDHDAQHATKVMLCQILDGDGAYRREHVGAEGPAQLGVAILATHRRAARPRTCCPH